MMGNLVFWSKPRKEFTGLTAFRRYGGLFEKRRELTALNQTFALSIDRFKSCEETPHSVSPLNI
jgi:hypothetical protein